MGNHTRFQGNDDLLLWRGPAVMKKPPFSNARAIITREIVRSRGCTVQYWGMTLSLQTLYIIVSFLTIIRSRLFPCYIFVKSHSWDMSSQVSHKSHPNLLWFVSCCHLSSFPQNQIIWFTSNCVLNKGSYKFIMMTGTCIFFQDNRFESCEKLGKLLIA